MKREGDDNARAVLYKRSRSVFADVFAEKGTDSYTRTVKAHRPTPRTTKAEQRRYIGLQLAAESDGWELRQIDRDEGYIAIFRTCEQICENYRSR
ncbi:hypothetical protein ACS0PU_009142 [Formica fusca]